MPLHFFVERFDQTQLQFSAGPGNAPWEGKPPITMQEAELLRDIVSG